MLNSERNCPRCGLALALGKLDGSCPACLFGDIVDLGDANDGDTPPAFWEDPTLSATTAGRGFSHYDLFDELGRGGMGTVYKARDRVTERIVALKVLQAHHLFEAEVVQRFRSEVRAISSLDHRHILPIHEVGEHDGVPFFSMKLASGGSLAQRLSDYVGQSRRAAQLLAKVARGVQHAHERGILHRDLKPGNILLDEAGEPYVCDFGLAKWIEDDRRLTLTSAVLGTPHYIAPEQAAGKQGLTIAADIYSLGAILYELLTGRPPFTGETAIDTLRQASENTPAKPSSIVNGTPRDIETICLKALQREPGARYATAGAFAEDLERWLSGRPIRARPVGAAEQLWRWARRNPLPAALSTALLLALTLGTTIAAIKIDRARVRAVAAEHDAREQLYSALLSQARASRMTSQAGHRIDALAAIQKAAVIRPSLELRNEAIAALTLVDLEVTKTFKVREDYNQKLAFDSALETVAVATDAGNINILSLADGHIQKTLTGVGQPIRSLVHSGSRYLAARCADDAVYVFGCVTGRQLARHPDHQIPPTQNNGFASDCIFSQDETLLALGSPEGIEINEVATGKTIARLKTIQPSYSAFCPKDRLLVFGNYKEKTIQIWNFASQDSPVIISLAAEPSCFAWSADGQKLAVGCTDYSIQYFRSDDWQNVGAMQGHRQPVMKAAFNHRGDMLFSTAADGTLRLWDLRTKAQLVELTGYVNESSFGFSPDDRYIGTSSTTSASIVEVVGLRRVCTAVAPQSVKEQKVTGSTIDYSPDSSLLAKASTTSVQIFDTKNGTHLLTVPIPSPTQTTLRFLADNKTLAVLSRRNGVTLLHFIYQGGKLELTTSDNQGQWMTYVFGSAPYDRSPYFCLTSDKEAKGVVWDVSTGETLCTLSDSPFIQDMAISPDKKWLVTTYRDRSAEIWAFPSGEKIAELPGGRRGIIAFSPSGRWFGLTGDAKYLLWDTETWTKGPSLPPQIEEKAGSFAFSMDESFIAVRILDQTALVSLPAGELLAVLEQHLQLVPFGSPRLSPDGTQLASQGSDNSLVLWDLIELKSELQKLKLHW